MKLSYKILTILFILFVFCASHIYAIDMFLNSISTNTNSQIVQNEENSLDNNNELLNEAVNNYSFETSTENDNDAAYLTTADSIQKTDSDLSTTPTINTTGVQTDTTLSVSDIISIILIAVCIVLILLAIAILIRCK